jgi:hypothetical protein
LDGNGCADALPMAASIAAPAANIRNQLAMTLSPELSCYLGLSHAALPKTRILDHRPAQVT